MQTRKIFKILLFAILAASIGYITARAWYGSKNIFISGRNPISQVVSLIFDNSRLIGESRGQVNILLLGIGGAGHDGPYLSDTIIVASIKPETSEVSLLSIPRDVRITMPGGGEDKINAVYAYSTAKYGAKVGLAQTRLAVSEFTGLDIAYATVVDFDGFIKAVDHLGGLDVLIDHTFTDSYYPNEKLGYIPPVTFKAGVEHMDGDRALIYARSRYSTSDFDRARRQQRIIEAFEAKVRELNFLKDIGTINKLFDDFTSHVATNLEPSEIKRLAELTVDVPQSRIYASVLDPTTGLICSYLSKEKGYHLTLCPGRDEKDLHKYVETAYARGRVALEKPAAEIQNATNLGGLAQAAGDQLASIAFKASFANAAKLTNSSETVVYDLTNGAKPNSLAVLLVSFGAKVGKTPPLHQAATLPDFIIVLGRDYRPPILDIINLDPPEPEEEDEDTEKEETVPADPKKTPTTSEKEETETPVGSLPETNPEPAI